MFRFTLGSDTADALVPRVVGGLGVTLLAVNHLLGGEPSEAQASKWQLCSGGVARCCAASRLGIHVWSGRGLWVLADRAPVLCEKACCSAV